MRGAPAAGEAYPPRDVEEPYPDSKSSHLEGALNREKRGEGCVHVVERTLQRLGLIVKLGVGKVGGEAKMHRYPGVSPTKDISRRGGRSQEEERESGGRQKERGKKKKGEANEATEEQTELEKENLMKHNTPGERTLQPTLGTYSTMHPPRRGGRVGLTHGPSPVGAPVPVGCSHSWAAGHTGYTRAPVTICAHEADSSPSE